MPFRDATTGCAEVNHKRSTILGLFALLLWSASIALSRRLSEELGPLAAGAAVYLTAGALLVGWTRLQGKSPGALRDLPLRYVLGCGALFVLYTAALFLALGRAADRQQAVEVGLVNYLWPALTVLLSLPILGKRAGPWLVPGTALAVLGVCLVVAQGNAITWRSFSGNLAANPLPYALGLAAAVSWALFSTLTRRWTAPGRGGAIPLFCVATGLALLVIRFLSPEAGSCSIRVVIEVAALGSVTAAANAFWDVAMRRGDVVLVAACSYLTPLFSTAVSCLYLGVRPGPGLWAGCLLLIVGSLASWASIERQGRAA